MVHIKAYNLNFYCAYWFWRLKEHPYPLRANWGFGVFLRFLIGFWHHGQDLAFFKHMFNFWTVYIYFEGEKNINGHEVMIKALVDTAYIRALAGLEVKQGKTWSNMVQKLLWHCPKIKTLLTLSLKFSVPAGPEVKLGLRLEWDQLKIIKSRVGWVRSWSWSGCVLSYK